MSFGPPNLFNITLDFVSANVECIDCLNEFPEIVGRKIFDRFMILSELALLPSDKQVKIIYKFVKAYKELVLESLELHEGLIFINEYFDTFTVLFTFISELCLCSCYLGDNHELFENISNFRLLKKLCLKKNCLKDGALRKITLPIRMFNKGPKNIEYLDLSDNKCTDIIAPWLAAFQHLQCLDLSGSDLTEKGVKTVENKCSLQLCSTESNIHPIVTKGWATPLIEKWNGICISRRETRKVREYSSYFKKKRYLMAEKSISNSSKIETTSKKMVFKKVYNVKSNHVNNVTTSEMTHSFSLKPVSYLEAEDDVFSQYIKP